MPLAFDGTLLIVVVALLEMPLGVSLPAGHCANRKHSLTLTLFEIQGQPQKRHTGRRLDERRVLAKPRRNNLPTVSRRFNSPLRCTVSAFVMLLLVFMTDFAKISLATDNVRPSKKPETWNIGGLITVSVVLGILMVAETLLLLWVGWSHFGLATDNNALYTFSFLLLLYFAVFSVVSARERHWFWATLPSKTFLLALVADALTGTVLTFVGLPDLKHLPCLQTLAVFVYAMVACLGLNDAVKVAMIKWRVPNAVTKRSEDVPVADRQARL